MEFLLSLDKAIFYFFNHSIAIGLLDKFFVLITTQTNWYIAYAVLIFFLIAKFKSKGLYLVILIAITILIADQLSSKVIKKAIGRVRPCREISDVRLLVPCGAGKSFPSSHAVNNFALAFVLAYFFRNYRFHLFLLAFLIAISRVYVGVHYPSDVIFGAILGLLVGYSIVFLHRKVIFRLFKGKILASENEAV